MKSLLNCTGNKNIVNGKTYSYRQKPVGEGKWMSVKEYYEVNCLAQDIEIRQESTDGPLLSPFGSHNLLSTATKPMVGFD
jgi:hypothetical protein